MESKYINKSSLIAAMPEEISSRVFDETVGGNTDGCIFILKKRNDQQNWLNIILRHQKEAEKLLATWGTIKWTGKFDGVLSVSDLGDVRIHVTGKGFKDPIATRDQETATCVVFNKLAQSWKDFEEDEVRLATIKSTVLETIGVDLPKDWIQSIAYQIQGIIEYIGEDQLTDYRMERYGGHSKYKLDENSLRVSYESMINKYTQLQTGSKKDNWDPSDVILYRVSKVNDLDKLFKDLTGKNADEMMPELRNLYMDSSKPFMGISFKKLNHSASLTPHNLDPANSIAIKNIVSGDTHKRKESQLIGDVILNKTYAEIYANVSGDINTEVCVTIRSFGKDYNYIDVKETSGPALGKCPSRIMMDELGLKSNKNIQECIDAFVNVLKDEKIAGKKLERIIQASCKAGPSCFPHMLLY